MRNNPTFLGDKTLESRTSKGLMESIYLRESLNYRVKIILDNGYVKNNLKQTLGHLREEIRF